MPHRISAALASLAARNRAVLAADDQLAAQHGWITTRRPPGTRIYHDPRPGAGTRP
jgi:hypothetical protein